jgi:methionyl-tRNA synthetase
MSKSKGNIVRTETILSAFGTLCPPPFALKGTGFSPSGGSSGLKATESDPADKGALAPEGTVAEPSAHDRDLFAADVLRYYLLREIPFGQDGSFSFEALITRYNADLANGYGNLVSRTLNMIEKYFKGEIPSGDKYEDARQGFRLNLAPAFDTYEEAAKANQFDSALKNISAVIKWVDTYLTNTAPWKLPEEAVEARARILCPVAESIRIITALLYPILPYATARVWAQLGLGDIELAAREGKLTNLQWGGLQPGTRLGPLGPIFPRADKGLAQIMTNTEEQLATGKLETGTPATETPTQPATTDPAAAPRTTTLAEPALTVAGSHATTTGPSPDQPAPTLDSPQIAIDDFIKIDLRVAQVTLCERIPKADKLLRLEVDLGPLGQRQILSGIAEWYTPEEMVGRRIIVIANLAPRKMRGLESHGMLLAASEEAGKPYLATVPEGVPTGTRLK